MENTKTIHELISRRDALAIKEHDLYMEMVEKINMETRELLNNDFGTVLIRNIGHDLAGEVARRYFDFGDYYITADQLYDRFVHFSYDNDTDVLATDEACRKALYNYTDGKNASTMREIIDNNEKSQQKLFTEGRAQDKLDMKGKINYRLSKKENDGKIYDELTGKEGGSYTQIKNGKEVPVSDLQADHVLPREAATYNERYVTEKGHEELKKFWNSPDNMQMMHASANTSKGDVRVCEIDGRIVYLHAKNLKSRQEKGEIIKDITYKATPEQMAEATISRWEKETKSGDKIQKLKEKGYLDENGKVKPYIRDKLVKNAKHAQNRESIIWIQNADYGNIAKDAASETKKAVKKILAGQIIYYVMPPMIFETQKILKRKTTTLDDFFKEIKRAGKRIIRYVSDKLGEILGNVVNNSLSKFIKTFFDIIIESVKATVKRFMKMLKSIVLSLVNCGRIILDRNASAKEKADSVTKILSTTITTIVLEVFFEYLEKQFNLPDFFMEPLQVIVTVLSTNIVMLVLNKVDLFDTKYGFLTSNIDKLFEDEYEKYAKSSEELLKVENQALDDQIQLVEFQIEDLSSSISKLDVYKTEALPYLDKISEMFDMGIDFNEEWRYYLQAI